MVDVLKDREWWGVGMTCIYRAELIVIVNVCLGITRLHYHPTPAIRFSSLTTRTHSERASREADIASEEDSLLSSLNLVQFLPT